MRQPLAAILLLALLGACAQPKARPAALPSALAGTTWALVAFQSMDDAQGRTVAADPSLYTLHLGADGRASLRLACNRGTASWSAEAGATDNGSIQFGPLASTRALCPGESMDALLARFWPYVRGYLLKDGRLYLSLMADGGVFEWKSRPEKP